MSTQSQRYNSTARQLLNEAWAALEEGDLIQASEKGWGAAGQAMKAVDNWLDPESAADGVREVADLVERLDREVAI